MSKAIPIQALPKDPHSIPVKSAFLQAAIYLVGTTETTLTHERLPGIQMEWLPGQGLLVNYKGKECLVPDTNVKVAFLDRDKSTK